MKKVLSLIMAVMMAFAAASVTTVAFAATVASPETTTAVVPNKIGQVNGVNSSDVTYTTDPTNPNKITFTYAGDGKFDKWEFPGMTEGVDYQIVSQDGKTITILLLGDHKGDVIANVIADTSNTTTDEDEDIAGDNDGDGTTAKKSSSSTSPDTGAAGFVGALGLAGAGIAVLVATKKKDAE